MSRIRWARGLCLIAALTVIFVSGASVALTGTAVGSDSPDTVEVADSTGIATAVDKPGEMLFQADKPEEAVSQVDQPAETLSQATIDADSIEMEGTVDTDGDADWRVSYRIELDTSERTQGFEDLQSDIEEEPSLYLEPFEDRIQRTADSAETATEREMSVQNFEVHTERTAQLDAEFGEVVFQFEWNSFASVDDDGTVRAGDGLDSLFLDEETRLTFRWGDSLQVDSHLPDADMIADQRLTWRGPLDFEPGTPRVVFVPADGQTPTDGTAPADETTPADGETPVDGDDSAGGEIPGDGDTATDGDLLPSTPILLAAFVVVVLAIALAVFLKQREQSVTDEQQPNTSPDSQEEPPSELLSNEERVLKLVKDNGGRIKQKEVAEMFDWSAAMTSQVVGNLREDGEVETFRIGRENVLTLPDVDIVPEQENEATDENSNVSKRSNEDAN